MDYEIMMNGNIKVGQRAPEFEAETTMGNLKLQDYKGKWLVVFSYPEDFTLTSTKELIKFARSYYKLQNMNADAIALGVDSISAHIEWLNKINSTFRETIPFPIISDMGGQIARKYGMIVPEVSNVKPMRSVFIIDTKGIIRTTMMFPIELERNFAEILRVISALQATSP